jgi:predicted aspartyl protease
MGCDAWVDTACSGDLVLPQDTVPAFGLPPSVGVAAILGDGSQVVLDSYRCRIDWFGASPEVEVVANTGQWLLLGVGLLRGHDLHVDYRAGTVTLL